MKNNRKLISVVESRSYNILGILGSYILVKVNLICILFNPAKECFFDAIHTTKQNIISLHYVTLHNLFATVAKAYIPLESTVFLFTFKSS